MGVLEAPVPNDRIDSRASRRGGLLDFGSN